MSLALTSSSKSIRTKIAEYIIESLKIYLVIKPLQVLYGKKYLRERFLEMDNCEDGTVGKDYVDLLVRQGVDFIPVFKEHDLKHLVLGYGMSSVDELRMQAYLFGNGNRSVFCILFLASAILLPGSWSVLHAEYQKGKLAPSVLQLKLADCIGLQTRDLIVDYNYFFPATTAPIPTPTITREIPIR